MELVRREAYTQALQSISGGFPRKLEPRALAHFEDESFSGDRSLGAFLDELADLEVNDGLRVRFHIELARWDNDEVSTDWAAGTEPLTEARRKVINSSLGIPESLHSKVNEFFPIPTPSVVVVSRAFEPWYDDQGADATSFYWDAYRNYLVTKRGWPAESIVALDTATTKVVERLSDPSREAAYRAKGLVVGYVQSGKTANFTGVVSKAIDAGYRLIIVLTGTVDILREQTQRRFDMELVGKENLLRNVHTSDPTELAKVDYYTDADWEDLFLEHGLLPSSGGNPDIIRLTGHHFDYKSLRAGITALEFEKAERSKPLNDKLNLARSNTRLLIVKKNGAVLDKLIKDLRKITTPLDEIPALLIDDESDQASVNTTNPKNWSGDFPEAKERNKINRSITEILKELKRCQYVGYTATPFANVFIDPSNEEDLFPSDFLLSLDKAPGYMGAADFHDLDWPDDSIPKTVQNSNEKRYVRDLRATDPKTVDLELRDAIDSFVLAGAIKLYRESRGKGHFRHHTMLVHETVRQADHRRLRDRIVEVWNRADYSDPSALARLRAAYLDDVVPVSSVTPNSPLPESFDELKSFIGASISRIGWDGGPVVVVNGDKEISSSLSFESHPVWKILVGGAKLSRGFTIEGLTISYYRRKVNTADSLMQMGRWFGFRRGYQDLVRLFIQRSDGSIRSSGQQADLYKSFEAIVRDEELFRIQLKKYSVMVDGKPQVTPREIPPLVAQHLPYLRPTATNKMFNAKLQVRKVAGEFLIPYAYPISPEASRSNFDLLTPLVSRCAGNRDSFGVPLDRKGAGGGSADCFYSIERSANMVDLLSRLEWLSDDYFEPEINHLKQLGDKVSDWVVLMPQLRDAIPSVEVPGVGARSVFKRSHRQTDSGRPEYWGETTDPRHRRIAERIVGVLPACNDPVTDGLHAPKRAAMLLYPIFDTEPKPSSFVFRHEELTLAVAWILPSSVVGVGERLVQFVARNLVDEQKIILDLSKTPAS